MADAAYSYTADGDIHPARFVKPSTSTDFRVVECSANTDKPCGISRRGTRNAPYSSLDDGLAAKAGEGINVFVKDQLAKLEISATVTRGDLLMSHTDGTGRTLTSGNWAGARARMSGVSGQIIDVEVLEPVQLN